MYDLRMILDRTRVWAQAATPSEMFTEYEALDKDKAEVRWLGLEVSRLMNKIPDTDHKQLAQMQAVQTMYDTSLTTKLAKVEWLIKTLEVNCKHLHKQ